MSRLFKMRIAHRSKTGNISGELEQTVRCLQLEAGVVPGVHTGGCLRPGHKLRGPGEDGPNLLPAQALLGAVHGHAGDGQLALVLCRLRQAYKKSL